MRQIYTFTPEERRVVLQAYQKYTQVLGVIGDLHGLTGEIAIAQDFSGFVGPDAPAIREPEPEPVFKTQPRG
jgi:hypothetical protein